MTIERNLKQMAQLAGSAAELAAAGQTAGIGVLLAEMQSMAAMMTGTAAAQHDAAELCDREARRRADEAEIEALFDNMPV